MAQIMLNRMPSFSFLSITTNQTQDNDFADNNNFEMTLRTQNENELIERLSRLAAVDNGKFLPDFAEELKFDLQRFNQYLNSSNAMKPDINLLPNGQLIIWNEVVIESATPRGIRYDQTASVFDLHTNAYHQLNTTLQMHDTEAYIDNSTFIKHAGQIQYASIVMHLFNGESITYPTTNWQMPTQFYLKEHIIPINNRYTIINLMVNKIMIINSQNHVVDTLPENIDCHAVSPSGLIAFGNVGDRNIRLYQLNEAGKLILNNKWQAHNRHVRALAFLSDGTLASGGGGGLFASADTIKIWNVKTYKLINELAHKESVAQLISLPNNWLCSVTESDDARIRVWNVPAKRKEIEYHGSNAVLTPNNYLGFVTNKELCFIKLVSERKKTKFVSSRLKLFHCHNLLKRQHGNAPFSNLSFNQFELPAAIQLIASCHWLLDVDLSNNNLSARAKRQLYLSLMALLSHPQMKHLNLAGNNLLNNDITAIGNHCWESKTLETINFSNNDIELDYIFLNALYDKLSKVPTLTSVDISQNFLKIDTTIKFERKGDANDDSNYHFLFFKTRPRGITSRLDRRYNITSNEWLATVSCKKGQQHTVIFLEGMMRDGTMIFKKYHFIEDRDTDKKGFGLIIRDSLVPAEFKTENYYHDCHRILNFEGENLRRIILDDSNTEIYFDRNISYAEDYEDQYNCLTWALKKFKQINIVIPAVIPPTPTHQAGGPICNSYGEIPKLILKS